MMEELVELYAVYDGKVFDLDLGKYCVYFQFKKSGTSNISYGSGCFWKKENSKTKICGTITISNTEYYIDDLQSFCNSLQNLLIQPQLMLDDLESFCLQIINIENLYYKCRGFLRGERHG